MIKKNAKILLAYIIGVVASLFLTVPLSPVFGFSPLLFSTLTAFITLAFVYSEMWKFGKYDALKKKASLLQALGSVSFFVAISLAVELISVLFNSTGNIDVPTLIGVVWFYPFTGFFTNTNFLPVTIIVTVTVVIISVAAYYMGVAGISISDNILNARKKRIDKKAEKHFEEIEKIKEQYRKKD